MPAIARKSEAGEESRLEFMFGVVALDPSLRKSKPVLALAGNKSKIF
jgi:hypothetical protein